MARRRRYDDPEVAITYPIRALGVTALCAKQEQCRVGPDETLAIDSIRCGHHIMLPGNKGIHRKSVDRKGQPMKRLHVSVGVTDLEHSVEFYTTLFDAKPTVRKPGYAKWMLEDPRVNFVLDSRGCKEGVDHLGIQVDDDAELEGVTRQLAQAEAPLIEQPSAECCYSKSDKTWSLDPVGVRWEVFHTHDDIAWYGADTNPLHARSDDTKDGCCGVTPSVEAE